MYLILINFVFYIKAHDELIEIERALN